MALQFIRLHLLYVLFLGVLLGYIAVDHTSGVATSRATWIAPLKICGIQDVLKAKFSIISILSSEVVLLVLMLTGLLRWKNRGKGGLWHLLFSQVNLS